MVSVLGKSNITPQVQQALATRQPAELALGWLRYEALRKLTPRQFGDLYRLNLRGRAFDELVDDLIKKEPCT